MKYKSYIKSPVGVLEIIADSDYILAINYVSKLKRSNDNALTKKCVVQLNQYFSGKRRVFDLPWQIDGTDWQKKVWQKLFKIPFGSIVSYGQLAKMLGNPKGARAVGNAVNKNKIPIIIPCHRVLGSDTKLVGYAGGLWRKKNLLKIEGLTVLK